MNRVALLTSVTVALAMSAVAATAQMQQKGPEEKGGAAAQKQEGPSTQQDQGASQQGGEKAEPKVKGEKGTAQDKGKARKGTAQTEPKDKAPTGTVKGTESKDKAPKGAAEKSTEPKDKAPKGAAEKSTEPKDKAPKGAAEKGTEPKDKTTKGAAEKGVEPKDRATAGPAETGSARRVQLSEQQRSNVTEAVQKDRRVNRVTNVNFTINIGARVPRSARLAVLPPSVIAIVPAYRSYRYFVVDEQLVIIDPASYEIVEIVVISGPGPGPGRAGVILALTDQEKAIIRSEIGIGGGQSRLALGEVTEGAAVPRDVELRTFPDVVVRKVPKVRNYRFFTAENFIAVVDPREPKVRVVIDVNR